MLSPKLASTSKCPRKQFQTSEFESEQLPTLSPLLHPLYHNILQYYTKQRHTHQPKKPRAHPTHANLTWAHHASTSCLRRTGYDLHVPWPPFFFLLLPVAGAPCIARCVDSPCSPAPRVPTIGESSYHFLSSPLHGRI